jgi:hypothetical protein
VVLPAVDQTVGRSRLSMTAPIVLSVDLVVLVGQTEVPVDHSAVDQVVDPVGLVDQLGQTVDPVDQMVDQMVDRGVRTSQVHEDGVVQEPVQVWMEASVCRWM